MQKRDFYLWSALLFSLTSHVVAFLQFSINFPNLGLPARWFLQFTILAAGSLLCAVAQFLLHPRGAPQALILLLRLLLLFIATYPLGNYINVRTTLLTSLVFECMIYFTLPLGLAVSIAVIAASLLLRSSGPSWEQPAGSISLDNLLFMGFYPLVVMVLGATLKVAQRLAGERKRLVEQLRRASRNLVETNIALQEHVMRGEERATLLERERISRELHDTIGYTLMNIIATMKASLELSKSDTDRMREFMTKGIEQAQMGLAETRSALRALRSTTPQRLSVIAAVDRLVAAFKDTHIVVSARYSNIPWYFSEEVDEAIYRIVQEGITNAIRHGNATEITVHLSFDGQRIGVTVGDNGGGAAEIREGIGLAGIRERLTRLQGGLSAGNAAGGFLLYAWIPRPQEA